MQISFLKLELIALVIFIILNPLKALKRPNHKTIAVCFFGIFQEFVNFLLGWTTDVPDFCQSNTSSAE